ncbi:MAG: SLOG family protein, partial [Staphylococcus lugdunensis]|nr:SLOG family protein [Staphylococcus lugdunensis]
SQYKGAFQFKQADRFMLEHSDLTLLISDEEQEGRPKFFKAMLVDFMSKTNYTCDIVTFDELQDFINDLQWAED